MWHVQRRSDSRIRRVAEGSSWQGRYPMVDDHRLPSWTTSQPVSLLVVGQHLKTDLRLPQRGDLSESIRPGNRQNRPDRVPREVADALQPDWPRELNQVSGQNCSDREVGNGSTDCSFYNQDSRGDWRKMAGLGCLYRSMPAQGNSRHRSPNKGVICLLLPNDIRGTGWLERVCCWDCS